MAYRTHTLRRGRFSEIGRAYLITITTDKRHVRFMDWFQARPVIEALKVADQEMDVATYAWVVMPDHLHWLFSLRNRDLGSVVGRFKSRSTLGYNRGVGRTGKLWQKGYHDSALRSEQAVRQAARYIVANPLRAGLVRRVGDYPMWDARWLAL